MERNEQLRHLSEPHETCPLETGAMIDSLTQLESYYQSKYEYYLAMATSAKENKERVGLLLLDLDRDVSYPDNLVESKRTSHGSHQSHYHERIIQELPSAKPEIESSPPASSVVDKERENPMRVEQMKRWTLDLSKAMSVIESVSNSDLGKALHQNYLQHLLNAEFDIELSVELVELYLEAATRRGYLEPDEFDHNCYIAKQTNNSNSKAFGEQNHPEKGIISHETSLSGYTLTPLPEELQVQPSASKAKSKVKNKADDGVAPLENRSYSGRQMMKRLKCGDRLLRIKRSQPDFAEWSQERDPDGVAWQYKDGQFVPLKVSQVDTAPVKEEAQPKPSSTKSKTKQKQKTTNKTKKASVAKAPSLESRPYSGRQMMKRLKCGDRLLRIKRSQPDFSEWSQQRDPEGIAWKYQKGEFVPLEVSTLDAEPGQVKSPPKPSKSKTKTKSPTKQKQKTVKKKLQKAPAQATTLENQAYSGRQLMQRFRCGERLLRIKRSQPDFAEWSQERDPEGIAWQYQKGQFVPVEVSTLDSEPGEVESPPKPSTSKTKTKSKTNQKQKTVKQKTTKKTKGKATATTSSLEKRAYTVRQVMERFHCGDRLLRIKRSQPDFAEWSQKRDPDGIPWKYQKGQFVPQMV